MKYIKFLFFILFISLSFNLSVDAKKIEKDVFKVVDNSILIDIIETSDGGYFAAGGAMATDEKWPFPARYAVKLDKDGEIEWEYRDNYIFSMWSKVQETEDGGFVVVGSKSDPSTYNIVKFGKNGEVLWENTGNSYELEGYNIYSSYTDVVVDEEGYVAVGTNQTSWYDNGDITLQKNDKDGLIKKYNSKGNIIWENEFEFDYDVSFNNIILLDDGTYLVTGYYKSSKDLGDLAVTENNCGLFINYAKNGDILYRKSRCESGKDVSFGNVIKFDDGYFVDTTVSDDKYVYLYNENFEYEASYNLADSDATNSFFYVYEDLFMWIDVFNTEAPFSGIVKFYDKNLNLLYTVDISLVFNYTVFNFYKDSDGNLIIFDIILNEEYTKNSEMLDSSINFYRIAYDIKVEDTSNGNYEIEQDGEIGKIIIKPDEGYVLDTIKIVDAGGNNKDYYEKDGIYYFELEDGLTVNVSYKEVPKVIEDVKNPETGVYLGLRVAFIVLTLISIIYLKIRKKQSFLIN